jgi:muconolactone D-isomerase
MEFLVRIEVSLPGDMPDASRKRGAIERIWRLPGGLRNVGIWEAEDATELHDLISSLPFYPWLHAEVTALAVHPLEAAG